LQYLDSGLPCTTLATRRLHMRISAHSNFMPTCRNPPNPTSLRCRYLCIFSEEDSTSLCKGISQTFPQAACSCVSQNIIKKGQHKVAGIDFEIEKIWIQISAPKLYTYPVMVGFLFSVRPPLRVHRLALLSAGLEVKNINFSWQCCDIPEEPYCATPGG
jgi:hypothetical protein